VFLLSRLTYNTGKCFALLFALFTGLALLPINGNATYAPSLKWHTLETEHFLIHYHTGLKPAADEIARLTPTVHKEVTEFFNWIPKEKTHIVLSNQSEKPNGSASVLPYNRIELLMSPPSDVSGLEDYQNWRALLLKHEYVHIVSLDKAADLPLDARGIMGRYFLFFPNTFLPRWISEGMATFIETDNQLQTGRGQSSYYRGLMRNELLHGFKSLNQINQKRSEWPSGMGYYLYGVYFYNFIRDTYGEEKISEFVEKYSAFPIPYFINVVSKQTFGKNTFALWDEFEVYLKNIFAAELNRLHSAQQTQTQNLSNSGYFSGFSQVSNGKLYYIRSNRETLKVLVERDIASNKEKIITYIRQQDYIFPQSFDTHPDNGILIPLLQKYENFQASFDLYQINPKTGQKIRLTKNRRYIRAAWNQKGDKIVALANSDSKHKLDLLDAKGRLIKTLWTGKPGVTINAFDWSPVENKLIVSIFTATKGWNLSIFNLENARWYDVSNNASIETYPQFNYAGNKIIYNADYNGIYNAYQLDLMSQKITQLTNSKTIALFPVMDEINHKLYFTELDKNGFNLKVASPQQQQIYEYNIPKQTSAFLQTPNDINKTITTPTKPYSGFRYLTPTWWLPVYVSDNNQSSLGFFTRSSDPLNWHNYAAQMLFDSKNQEFRWNLTYLNQKNAIYYSINSRREAFNSKFLERQETESTAMLIRPYIKQDYSWNFFSSIQYIQTQFSIPDTSLNLRIDELNFISGVSLDTTSKNLLAVFDHDGIKANISYEVNEIDTRIEQHSRILLYGGIFSPPLKHAVFEASGTLVAAGNNARKTFLGGTEVNRFSGSEFGKNTFSLSGYALNRFINTNMQKLSVKLHYPLFYPDTGFMRPPLGVNRLILNMIAEQARIGTFRNINAQPWLSSIASELNIKANFGFGRYPFDITAGIAKGLGEWGETTFYYNFSLNF